jgi:hypothetical protein
MRALAALVVIALLAAVSAVPGGAARLPTTRERTDVARAVSIQLEHDSPNVTVKVNGVRISTTLPGKGSTYSRFAAANAVARAKVSGGPLDEFSALVGFSRRFHVWVVMSYGSAQVGCPESRAFFGGRKNEILRDLGLDCG